jgi:hypothetical protein
MPAPLALALALGLAAATPPPAAGPTPRCPGLSLDELETRLAAAERFAFTGAMRAPFMLLWGQAERPPLPLEPDSVTLLAAPGQPFLIIYGRTGCALAVLRAGRPEVFQALRSSIGPAV